MKNLAIIQARTGSSRLPDKVLMKLEDKTVIEHVFNRVKKSRLVSDIVVATTLKEEDLRIVKICAENNIKVYCGSENDVLDRFYQIAKILNPDNIVRITADCPVIDPNIIDLVIVQHIQKNADYTCNGLDKVTFPDGQDVEVIKFEALKIAYLESTLKSEKEHVTPFIRYKPDRFKLLNVENTHDLSDQRWTLDNIEDFKLLKIIFSNLYQENNFFGMEQIFKFIEKNPDVKKINDRIIRNEGYQKSLIDDLKD